MALSYARGVVQWNSADGVSTTYTVSGLSFQPTALRFFWNGIGSATDAESQSIASRRGMGFATSTSSRRCVGTYSADAAANADCGSVACDDSVAVTVNGSGTRDGLLDLNSITSDGFTLIVDDAARLSAYTVAWEAWGGTSVAAIVDIAEPVATGNVNYTVTGFDTGTGNDQVVMFAGVQSVSALNTGEAQDSGFCVGHATGSANQGVYVGNSDDGSANMDTDAYAISADCLAMILVAGGNPNARAQFVSFGTNQFTLNWVSRALTNRRYIALALKGGKWAVGETTINGTSLSATATVSGLSFAPIGLCVFGKATSPEATAGTSAANDHFNIGFAASTSNRIGFGHIDINSAADSSIGVSVEYDQIAVGHSNSTAAVLFKVDVDQFNSDGFRLIIDDEDAGADTATWFSYCVCGAGGNEVTRSYSHVGTMSRVRQVGTTKAYSHVGTLTRLRAVTLGTKSYSHVGTLAMTKGLLYQVSKGFSHVGSLVASSDLILALSKAYSHVATLTRTNSIGLVRAFSHVGSAVAQKAVSLATKAYSHVGTLASTESFTVSVSKAFSHVGTAAYSRIFNAVRVLSYAATHVLTTLAVPSGGGAPPPVNPWFQGKTIYPLASKAGLTEWVDYIPVKAAASSPGTFDNAGAYPVVQVLSSTTDLVAWVDYIPVYVEAGRTLPWRTDADGYIPFEDVTP